jgi:class 3 adenylate cyclase
MLARAFFSSRRGDAGDLFLASFDDPARAVRCAIAMHIGARVAASAGPGEIVVSSTVTNWLAGSGIVFTDRGLHAPEGIPEDWRLFATDERTG